MTQTTTTNYDRVAIALHWLMALLVLAQIALGWWMIGIPKEPVGVRSGWFNLHKSIGMVLAVLVFVRIGWRLAHRPPSLPGFVPGWQRHAAAVNHALLYACLVVMPVAGFLGSTFSGFPIKFFGITLAGWGWKNTPLKDFFSLIHLGTAWLLCALIALHVAAALKHLLAGDGVFGRMWSPRAPARGLAPHRAAS